ncbi:EI24 domain-containing protein [Caminibacter sp.]
MKISVCISKSFKNLFDPDVLKVVFALSLPIFIFYFGILFFFWDNIIQISYHLISWVPFSVLKLNGAFFIMFFLWFISVVVSFAVITAIFSPLFLKKAGERAHYVYVVSSIIFFSLLYAFLFITKWDFIYSEIQRLLTILPFDTVSKAVGAILAVYIFYNLFILTLFIAIFFFAKPLLEAIKEAEYPDVEINKEDKFAFKRVFLKDVGLFVLLFILLFPLFFVPVINIGIQLFLWTKLYHDSFLYFVCNEYCSNDVFEEIKNHNLKTILLASFAASFNFLPIINFFAPFFTIILFFHCVMQLVNKP